MNRSGATHPLTRRLPLVIGLLLAVTAAGVSWAAYDRVYQATLATANARLHGAAQEIASMLFQAMRRLRRDADFVGRDPSITAFVANPRDARNTTGAERVLNQARSRSTQYVALSLWSKNDSLLLAIGSARVAGAVAPTRRIVDGRDPAPLIAGPLVGVDSLVVYGITVPVVSGVSDTIGYFVAARRVAETGWVETIERLVGQRARFMIGNSSGNLWTNLAAAIPAPGPLMKSGELTEYVAADGDRHMGAATPVAGTPWSLWVEFPAEVALGPARQFLLDIVFIGSLFVLTGGLTAWFVVRQLVRPLGRMKLAAEQLALGDYSQRIEAPNDDELGSLAQSLNAMAGRVERSAQELEARATMLETKNQALRESELRYRQLVDHSPDGVLVHRQGSITFANARAAEIIGVPSAAELVGRSLLDFVHLEDRDLAADRVTLHEADGVQPPLAQMRLVRVDGAQANVEVTATPFVVDGATAVQMIVRDVTERRKLEEQFRQAQKMEAVGRLAGGIAHDFNNLLTVIHTYSELSLASSAPDDPRRGDLEEIRRASNSAAQLTRQMLAFSRKQPVAPRVIQLNEAINGLTEMIERIIGDDIAVVTELRSELAPIWADAGQLEQILVNLAVNARDAMPRGGLLKIETGNVTLDHASSAAHGHVIPPGEYVLLAVSDTGIGMADDVRARIFEPFFTTKQPGRGTGLGLSTVYGIVKQSDGFIWVYSEPERGTTFRIYLPRYVGSETSAPAATNKRPAVPSGRSAPAGILLVEDEPRVREAIKRVLESAGFVIAEADQASSATTQFALRRDEIDLVITDMMMPGKTGAELVVELTRARPELRAIIMSGYSEEVTSRQWRLPPNALFMEKPVSPNDLIRRVKELLGLAA